MAVIELIYKDQGKVKNMAKKLLILFLAIFIGVGIFGCAKVVDTLVSTCNSIGALPAGTTAVKLSASNIVASGNNLTFNLSALNQSNSVLSGIGGGNFTGTIYTSDPSISSVTASTTLTATATLTWTAVSGGGTGTAKDVAALLAIDKSGTMSSGTGSKRDYAEKAAIKFLSMEATNANNKAAILVYDHVVSLESSMLPVAANQTSLEAAVNVSGFGGGTAL
ncbi:MAG: hypothetical protein FD145_702 [Candidatus Saganbacteria bacterium]|uniref:Uncharacterized protein n=1 Tax=Candidatus Saganbacteria bacterium TaxID=2575572 RepID=A0A833L190_UNCSA|nr:MAG: hypothetical protein FD145_702 [Candidatus Saganbacteria bacterium]